MQGVIKKKLDRGYGFIAADGLEKEIFFHSEAVVGTTFDQLQEGETVSFETEESPKGLKAVNVQRA